MQQTASISKTTLSSWLQAVNSHLEVRREEVRAQPSPKRNRAREKARREARQLFAQYHAHLAISQYS